MVKVNRPFVKPLIWARPQVQCLGREARAAEQPITFLLLLFPIYAPAAPPKSSARRNYPLHCPDQLINVQVVLIQKPEDNSPAGKENDVILPES